MGDCSLGGGRSGRIVRDHPGGSPVAGEHHGGRGRAPTREFGREADVARVRGDAALDGGDLGGGGKPPADRAGREGTTRSLGSGLVAVRSERKARATPAFTNRTCRRSGSFWRSGRGLGRRRKSGD